MDRTAGRTLHPVTVTAVTDIAPHMRRFRITGEVLATMPVDLPGQWLKVFFPMPPEAKRHGRAYTIRTHFPAEAAMDVDFVLHGDNGGASRWATRARVGETLEVAGPREGYRIDPAAREQLLIGDSTSLPAIAAILEALPETVQAHVILEVTDAEEAALVPARAIDRIAVLPCGGRLAGTTGQIEAALAAATISPAVQAWVAGEATMVRRVCAALWERGVGREATQWSGYWREGVADHRD